MSATGPIAIIGAGISGLTLALALHAQGLRSTIYETRSSPLDIGGAIMLSPNALRILDSLNLYQALLPHGYAFSTLDWYSVPESRTVETYEFGSVKKYGYPGLRIYRSKVIEVLMERMREVGIEVRWGVKFVKVVSEDEDSAEMEFEGGEKVRVSLVVGADGIHSKVRGHLYPDLKPSWTGMAGITAAVPTGQLGTEDGRFEKPITYMHPERGAFVIAPQEVDGSEVLIGKQRRVERELSREEWDAVRADGDGLVRFLREGNEGFPEVVVNATREIEHGKINVWPFYVIPKLEAWASKKRRVLIVGDAAHAIPPSAGQGINQAFEDVYVLALLLKEVDGDGNGVGGEEMAEALSFWQTFRQGRVDRVLELNKQIDLRRLPEGTIKGTKREEIELSWLYNADFEKAVQMWVGEGKKGMLTEETAKQVAHECPIHGLLRAFGSVRE